MKRHRLPSSALAALVVLSVGVSAGIAKTIVLRSGQEIHAEIIRQDDQAIILDLGYDLLRVPRSQIQTISDDSPAQEKPRRRRRPSRRFRACIEPPSRPRPPSSRT